MFNKNKKAIEGLNQELTKIKERVEVLEFRELNPKGYKLEERCDMFYDNLFIQFIHKNELVERHVYGEDASLKYSVRENETGFTINVNGNKIFIAKSDKIEL